MLVRNKQVLCKGVLLMPWLWQWCVQCRLQTVSSLQGQHVVTVTMAQPVGHDTCTRVAVHQHIGHVGWVDRHSPCTIGQLELLRPEDAVSSVRHHHMLTLQEVLHQCPALMQFRLSDLYSSWWYFARKAQRRFLLQDLPRVPDTTTRTKYPRLPYSCWLLGIACRGAALKKPSGCSLLSAVSEAHAGRSK